MLYGADPLEEDGNYIFFVIRECSRCGAAYLTMPDTVLGDLRHTENGCNGLIIEANQHN